MLDRRSFISSSVCAGLAFLTGATSVAAASVVVDKNDPDAYDSIQAAVDASAPGATVSVAPGTYTETVRIGKSLVLDGEAGGNQPGPGSNAPVIDADRQTQTAAIKLNDPEPGDPNPANGVEIRGFEIRNVGQSLDSDGYGKGIAGGLSSDVTIRDCRFVDIVGRGITNNNPGHGSRRNWRIRRNVFERIASHAISVTNTQGVTIGPNVIRAEQAVPDTGSHYEANSGRQNDAINVNADVSNGYSAVTKDVEVVDNHITGRLDNNGIYVSAINENDPGSDTYARVRNVTIRDNDVVAAGGGRDYKAIRVSVRPDDPGATTSVSGVTIRDNLVDGTEETANRAFHMDTASSDGIRDVVLKNNHARNAFIAFDCAGHGTHATSNVHYEGNRTTDCTVGLFLRSQSAFGGTAERALADVTAVDNDFSDLAYGVVLTVEQSDGISNVVVSENHIENNDRTDPPGYGVLSFGDGNLSEVRFERNDIAGNTVGAANFGVDTLSMECNWWGSPQGPTTPDDSREKGDLVKGAVDYRPWLPQSFERVPKEACHVGGGADHGSGNSRGAGTTGTSPPDHVPNPDPSSSR